MHTGFLRTLRTAFLLSPAVAFAACGGPSGPVDGGRAMSHVEALVKIGPRPFGSDNLAKAADYICDEVKKLGLEPLRHEVVHEAEKKTIRNLYTKIDGADPEKGPIVMFGAHYDTKLADGHDDAAHNFPFVGAIDGGGAPAVLLELAREIKALPADKKPKANIWFYWIDAEESVDWVWNDDRALLGSQAFCKFLSKEKVLKRVKAFVLLDLIGSKDFKIDRDGNSNPRLLELFHEAAEQMGAADKLYEFPDERLIAEYRNRGINWGTKDDHESFKNFGVKSVLLIDFANRVPAQPGERANKHPDYEQWWHTPDDNLDAMDPAALAFAGNLVMQALPALDEFAHGKKK